MKDRQLLIQLAGERVIPARLWAYASLLGTARRWSNQGKRKPTSDRGPERGAVADMVGALGELVAYSHLREHGASSAALAHIRAHAFDPRGGGATLGADLVLDGGTLRVDAKAHDCDPRKRYVAINAAKHDAIRETCDAYIVIAAAPLGRRCVVSSLVPLAEVDGWEVRDLGGYGDPARVLDVPSFGARYAPGLRAALPELRRSTYEVDAVQRIANNPEIRERLRRHFPGLLGVVT